jgi:hypothetical protein
MLQAFPFHGSARIARHLANLTTFDGRLPQGAPTSPILANLICRRLDSRLFKWARNNGCTYTRYADDLTFSTNKNSFPRRERDIIKSIVRDEGFGINLQKERLMASYERQIVTGIIVNEKLNVPREYRRGLRALLRNVFEFGWKSQVGRESLFDSKEQWRTYINGEVSASTLQTIESVQAQENLLLSPGALIPTPGPDSDYEEPVEHLKDVVRGRIERLGNVRAAGMDREKSEDPMYRRLRSDFEYAKEFSDQIPSSSRYYLDMVERIDPDYRKRVARYRNRMREIDDADREGLESIKEDFSDRLLELDFAAFDLSTDRLRGKLRQAAYRELTSSRITGGFFKFFQERNNFSGLLHPLSSGQNTREIFRKADASFKAFKDRIPNNLEHAVDDFLQAVKERIGDVHTTTSQNHGDGVSGDVQWHPWEDQSFQSEMALPFKRNTRLDDDPLQATDLQGVLEDEHNKVNAQREETVELHTGALDRRIFTYTPDVVDGLRMIVHSMTENSRGGPVWVEWASSPRGNTSDEGNGKLSRVDLLIYEEGAEIENEPDLKELFGQKLRTAVERLRGYAGWRLSARFKDGCSYDFDVMKNERLEMPAEPLHRLTHRIMFYQ